VDGSTDTQDAASAYAAVGAREYVRGSPEESEAARGAPMGVPTAAFSTTDRAWPGDSTGGRLPIATASVRVADAVKPDASLAVMPREMAVPTGVTENWEVLATVSRPWLAGSMATT